MRLLNGPKYATGTCLPGGSSLPVPPIAQPEMLFHYDASHIYFNSQEDYYGNNLDTVRRSDWTADIKGEKSVMWVDFHYLGKTVKQDNLILRPGDHTLESLIYPKVGELCQVYGNLNLSSEYIRLDASGVNGVAIPGGSFNRWLHVVYQKTGSDYSVYINGALLTSFADSRVVRLYRAGYQGYEFGYARGFYGVPDVNELFDEATRWLELFGQSF